MRAVEGLEDTHFYIDNAPPEEVGWVLRCMSSTEQLSPRAIADRTRSEYGFQMQRDTTYSPRRLYDLGLVQQSSTAAGVSYTLTRLGVRLREIMALDPTLYAEVLHFLHYSRYDGRPETRKYFWSYRSCSEIIWMEGRVVPAHELAARIQDVMRQEFPYLDFGARVGARFDGTAAGRFYTWIRQLSPSPLPEGGDVTLRRRNVEHHELALLSIDHVYRVRGYRYGDPVILDELLLDELARVFFLELNCYRELLSLAAKLTRLIVSRDTFAGTSVTLQAHYGIENI